MTSNRIHCESIHTSLSCNRYSHCIDCNHILLCIAAKHSIALYNIETFKIVKLLNGHKSQVNSVRWIGNDDKFLVSSSLDTTAIIWQIINNAFDYEIKYKLLAHTESVITAKAIHYKENEIICVTTSTDKTLRVWKNDKQLICHNINEILFDIQLCNYGMFANIVIISAGTDGLIRIYECNEEFSLLSELITLKGHEDWIRSIDCYLHNGSLFIASSSQDFFIRVHKIIKSDKLPSNMNESVFTLINNDVKCNFLITLETVLSGHDGWVNEIRWYKSHQNCLQLLSASMDKTMVLWQSPIKDSIDDIWTECARVGEIGGNTLGFLGCASSPQLNVIMAYSFNGALHVWKYINNVWQSYISLSGHFDEVSDIAWEPKGEYLLSCSLDQTTRLHAPCVQTNSWHEIARPQIHGYDLKCIAMINRLSFASGADEKVIRLFQATKCFINSLKTISNINLLHQLDHNEEVANCASVPSLGLSNRAIYEMNHIDYDFKPSNLEEPPTEEILLQNTLWPETQKLYGHGYELFSLACNHAGTVLASACKASKSEHACVILWNIKDANQMAVLPSHQLTVTQIRFSPNDKFLLTVSRDRTWSLFNLNEDNFPRIAFSDKKTCIHSRIIWDCSWTPDNQFFVTVSRDKTANFWFINSAQTSESSNLGCVESIEKQLILSESITSVDILCEMIQSNYLTAIGLENGNISLYFWNNKSYWTHLMNFDDCHQLVVNRIRFSPLVEKNEKTFGIRLASCSTDCSVRIFCLSIG